MPSTVENKLQTVPRDRVSLSAKEHFAARTHFSNRSSVELPPLLLHAGKTVANRNGKQHRVNVLQSFIPTS